MLYNCIIEDITLLCKVLKNNSFKQELDLSHNKIENKKYFEWQSPSKYFFKLFT